MRFEDYAREAARALAASGRSVNVPWVEEMSARRRRIGLVQGLASIVILALGTVAVVVLLGGSGAADQVVADGSESGITMPAATIPVEDGRVIFGPPRLEGTATVEFPITLLDGTRLSLTLPRSLAENIQGLVPGGAASWSLDPCCGRTLDVIYGSVEELYGTRLPDVEYEDAEGNPVGFFTEDDDVDYLVFQYGSWVVRAWDGDPAGQRFTEENRARFASLMRGHETAEGFLVLDPVEPMSIGPTDSPDATLTTAKGEGSVGVFKWRDCATERPSANPDLVTSEGHLVSFAESSGMTSICFPDSSLYLWVSRIDLTEPEIEAIHLTNETDPPQVDLSTTTTTSMATTTTWEPLEGWDRWRLIAELPFTVESGAVVEGVDSGIVVAGPSSTRLIGFDGSSTTGTAPPLSIPFACCGTVRGFPTGDSLVLIDYIDATTWILDVESFDWWEADPKPTRGNNVGGWLLGAALINGELFVVDAASRIGQAASAAAALNLETGTWRSIDPMPSPLSVGGVTTDGERVIAAGTRQDHNNMIIGETTPVVYEYTDADGWHQLPNIPIHGQASTLVWVEGTGILAWNYGLESALYDQSETWRVTGEVPMPPSECLPESDPAPSGIVGRCGGIAWFDQATETWTPIWLGSAPGFNLRFAVTPDRVVALVEVGRDRTQLLAYDLAPNQK